MASYSSWGADPYFVVFHCIAFVDYAIRKPAVGLARIRQTRVVVRYLAGQGPRLSVLRRLGHVLFHRLYPHGRRRASSARCSSQPSAGARLPPLSPPDCRLCCRSARPFARGRESKSSLNVATLDSSSWPSLFGYLSLSLSGRSFTWCIGMISSSL